MAVTEVMSGPCGFCATRTHERCSIGAKHKGPHVKYTTGVVWVCTCTCNEGRRKCAVCGNTRTEEVSPDFWECIDVDACHAVVEARREASPFFAQLRDIKERVQMAKVQDNETKAKTKTAKVGKCLVTGEPTKGGLFKPGMDARYVSERVASVTEANFSKASEKDARTKMKNDGVSERLVAKFDKSLGLARDKAEKAKAAKAEKAKEKASA